MIETSLIQDTPEWHAFRRNMIGASMAATILSLNPYQSEVELWEELVGLRQPKEKTSAMQRGNDLEKHARDWYVRKSNIEMEPIVSISETVPYMSASLDGISKDRKRAIEIKCNGAHNHYLCLQGIVPEHHYPQLMHICCVCDLDLIDYVSFDGKTITNPMTGEVISYGDGVIIPVKRDDEFIKMMLKEEARFWHCVQNFISPLLVNREYKEIENDMG